MLEERSEAEERDKNKKRGILCGSKNSSNSQGLAINEYNMIRIGEIEPAFSFLWRTMRTSGRILSLLMRHK